MKKLGKYIYSGLIIIILTTLLSVLCNKVNAQENKNLIKEQIEYYSRNIDVNEIDKEDILKAYENLSEQYSNEEIADIIEENKDEIEKQGISEDVISAGTTLLRTTDSESVKEIIDFYKMDLQNLIVVYDDMDVEPGKIKIRKSGGTGTHNGMKSVVHELKDQNFKRIRVGIGTPEDKSNLIEYVIGSIPEDEVQKLDQGTTLAKEAIIETLKNGIDMAMNKFN